MESGEPDMTPETMEELLHRVDKRLAVIDEKLTSQSGMCDVRRQEFQALKTRVAELEAFNMKLQTYLRVLITLVSALLGLVSWSMNIVPKLLAVFGGA